jgi:hypothetical protein
MGAGGEYYGGYNGFQGELSQGALKGTLALHPEICLHLFLEVICHLGVYFHSGVCLCLEVHHLLLKVHFPLLVVKLHSHEEDYHHLL